MPKLRFISFFAGIGGIDLGLERAGHECVGQVEINPFCQRVLAKHWPDTWRHDDITTLRAEDIPDADLWTGGFPCQDISNAGKRAGIHGERSGLFFDFMRLVREIRPEYLLLENVAALLHRGMGEVLGELAESGYDAQWDVLPACAMGAPHTRRRVFIIAYRVGLRCPSGGGDERQDDIPPRPNLWETSQGWTGWADVERWFISTLQDSDRARHATKGQRDGDGVPAELDRWRCDSIQGYGNSVVPQVSQFIGECL